MQLKVRIFIFGANKVSLESVPGTWDYGVPYGFEMLAVPMPAGPILICYKVTLQHTCLLEPKIDPISMLIREIVPIMDKLDKRIIFTRSVYHIVFKWLLCRDKCKVKDLWLGC